MIKKGEAILSLHSGDVPRWLFEKMKRLSACIVEAIVWEFGRKEFLRRLSEPFWFQCFGCVLGFDWHSSGLTTTVTAALKEGLSKKEDELGIFFCGGKGKAARKTISEIEQTCKRQKIDASSFIYSSRMAAKIDNVAVQDGYTLYHHFFVFTKEGDWAVLQQGMNPETQRARRYHWLGEDVKDFVCEPHTAICGSSEERTLNMVAKESIDAQRVSVYLCLHPFLFEKHIKKVLSMPLRHRIFAEDICVEKVHTILLNAYKRSPKNFEELLSIEGVGAKTIRALALISEVIYGHPPSFKDPARFSFAHGGKDRHPYPIDPFLYEKSIHILECAIKEAQMKKEEKLKALKKLFFLSNKRWQRSS